MLNSNMAKDCSVSQKQLDWIELQKPNNFRTKVFFWEPLFEYSKHFIYFNKTLNNAMHDLMTASVSKVFIARLETFWSGREHCSVNVYHKKTLSSQAVKKSLLWLSEKRANSNYLPAFCSLKPLSLQTCRIFQIFKESYYGVENSIFRNFFWWTFASMNHNGFFSVTSSFAIQKSYKRTIYWTESWCLLFQI